MRFHRNLFGAALGFLLLSASASAGVYDLTGSSVSYDASTPKFGTADLAGGYASDALGSSPLPTNGTFTVEGWVKNAATSAVQVAYGQATAFWVGCDASSHAEATIGTSTHITTTTTLCDGTWHHTRLVATTSGTTFYVDNVSVGTAGTMASASPNYTAYRFIVADFDSTLGTYHWAGKVDEVAVFSVARSGTLPTNAYLGTEANIVALFHFDSNLTDSANPAYTGTGTYGLTSGTAAYDTTAQKIGSASLSGGYGYDGITQSPIPTNGTFTAEAWVKNAATSSIRVAYGQDKVFWVGCDPTSNAEAGYGGSSTRITTTTILCDGNWHHTAFVATSSGTTLYVDGASVGTGGTVASGSPVYTAYRFMVSEYDGYIGANTWAGEVDELAVFNTAKYSATFTPSTSAYTGSETGLNALFHFDSTINDSAAPYPVTFAPNDSRIYYSPANWYVQSGGAESINPGAYATFYYTGAVGPQLSFNVSADASPLPQVMVQIDNQPPVRSTVAATIATSTPAATLTWPRHLLRLIFAAMGHDNPSWSTRSSSVVLTGVAVASGQTIYAYTPAPVVIVAFGDSISQGYYTLSYSGAVSNLVNNSDATLAAPYLLGPLAGAEVGVVGFGGQWLAASGNASNTGAPPLTSAYNLLWAGQARTWPTNLSAVLINMGTNDFINGGTCASVTSGMTTVLNGLNAAIPVRARIIVEQPYDVAAQYSSYDACLRAGIAASTNPGRVTYVSTAGWMDLTQTADNIHPFGGLNLQFAQSLASSVKAALNLPSYSYQ